MQNSYAYIKLSYSFRWDESEEMCQAGGCKHSGNNFSFLRSSPLWYHEHHATCVSFLYINSVVAYGFVCVYVFVRVCVHMCMCAYIKISANFYSISCHLQIIKKKEIGSKHFPSNQQFLEPD